MVDLRPLQSVPVSELLIWHIWWICVSHSKERLQTSNLDFVYAVICRRLELDGWNFRFEKLIICSIYDYIWVKIAYGLEKIVLMPRTWRFVRLTLIKKIRALVMEIFDPEGRANFDFCILKWYLSKNLILSSLSFQISTWKQNQSFKSRFSRPYAISTHI